MEPLIEVPQAEQAQGPDQRKAGAGKHEHCRQQRRPVREVDALRHSITSPRNKNFASATVAVKPSKAMTSAISK